MKGSRRGGDEVADATWSALIMPVKDAGIVSQANPSPDLLGSLGVPDGTDLVKVSSGTVAGLISQDVSYLMGQTL